MQLFNKHQSDRICRWLLDLSQQKNLVHEYLDVGDKKCNTLPFCIFFKGMLKECEYTLSTKDSSILREYWLKNYKHHTGEEYYPVPYHHDPKAGHDDQLLDKWSGEQGVYRNELAKCTARFVARNTEC